MKTYIVPTDFSDLAAQAFDYAAQLARSVGGVVMPVHSYHVPSTAESFSTSLLEMMQKNAEDQMDAFMSKMDPGVPCHSKVTSMPLRMEIKSILKHHPEAVVVLATHGEMDWWDHFVGTQSSSLVNVLKTPVLVLHPNEQSKVVVPKKVLFATDGKELTEEVIEKWNDICNEYNLEAEAVQIVDSPSEEGKGTWNGIPVYKVYHENLERGLQEAMKTLNPDWLVAVHRSQNLWNQLWHKSLTKALALRFSSPLLVFHE